MARFIIQPHGRLNDWVADEKGYFADEGLDYELNVEGSRKNTPRLAVSICRARLKTTDSAHMNAMPKDTDAKAKAVET